MSDPMPPSSADVPIQFECPQCRTLLRVPGGLAGRNARCSSCQAIVRVPEPAGAPPSYPTTQTGAGAFGAPNVPPSTSTQFGAPSGSPLSAPMPSNASYAPANVPAPSASIPVSPMAVDPRAASPVSNAPMRTGQEVRPRGIREMLAAAGKYQSAETPTRRLFDRIVEQVSKVYVGQDELVLGTLVALFSSGHVLIESVPGLGKTLFVRTLGRILGCRFGRIQFTADLMPSDVTGAPIFNIKDQEFRFRPGPVFTQLLLADEINRAPAKTHASLLEIMQEYRVTVDGTSHPLVKPFLVIATQNPVESEGTYNLPEAQLDRFMMKLIADYPDEAEEARILEMHSRQLDLSKRLDEELEQVTGPEEILAITRQNADVRVDPRLVQYINRVVRATRSWPQFHLGASPRAGLALMQGARTLAAFCGRDYAVPDDVVQLALPVLRHRVVLTAEAEVEQLTVDHQLTEMLRAIEVPRL
ncbi:MAG TPA: AAA family ATPase [Pirellulaceae bacterium]|nr:AAA family ATPase [Pirellulaceae bacterium]